MSDTVDEKSNKLAESLGIKVQPPPMTTSNPSAHDLLIQYINSGAWAPPPFHLVDFTHLKEIAILWLMSYYEHQGLDIEEEIAKRKEFGLKKYGTPLTIGNGRDHNEDAAQEMIDFLVYYICAENELKTQPTNSTEESK